jgi:uncharacterized SAM-binding protein YcdF (DUF218 family)
MKEALRLILQLVRIFLMAVGILALLVTFTPLVHWAAWPLASGAWADVDQGVLIILSGSTTTLPVSPPNKIPGINTYWRTIHAIYLWRHGHFRNVVVSGIDTVETVKPLLVAAGIPERAILVENSAINTHENALFSKPLLAKLPGPYVLVTSDYHMYRAARCFAHEDIAVETMPAPDLYKRASNPSERWILFYGLCIEYGSIGYYRLRGWI